MSTVTLTANKSARANALAPDTNYSTETESPNSTNIYLGFPKPSSAYNYLPLLSLELHLFGKGTKVMELQGFALIESWQEYLVTWNNRPERSPERITSSIFPVTLGKQWVTMRNSSSAYALRYKDIINYGLALETYSGYPGPGVIDNSRSSNKPYIIVQFGDTPLSMTCRGVSPTSGFISKHTSNTFKWTASLAGVCLGNISVTNSKVRWKSSSGATPTVIDCGTAFSYTFAAETFSSDTIMWQAETTDSNGNISASPWYTLTTVEATSTAEVVEPVNSMIDGSADNVFRWNHVISTGTAQSKANLQKSSNGGSTWTTLATVTGSSTQAVIPAGTFSAGEWLWRVRTYNTDNTAGAWSTAASIVSITASSVSGVSASSDPRPLISWQCDDQVAFQVRIGGLISDIVFGTESTYLSPLYFDDGTYDVAVRAQNQYGLWSEWATAQADISNTPGADILLTGNSLNGMARLEWASSGAYDEFLIYRDDTVIAKTDQRSYDDYMAVGAHSYYVRGIYNNSYNFGKSSAVNLVLKVDNMVMIDYKTKSQIDLKYSDSSLCEQGIGFESESTVRRTYASAYPVAEISKHLAKSITGRVAFIDESDENTFKSFIGRMVIVKTPKDEMVSGPLTNISITETPFFNGYSFSVTHTYIKEEIAI